MDRQLSQKLRLYYRTPIWKKLSYECKKPDGWKCRACGRKGQYPCWFEVWRRRIPLMAHHLSYEAWKRKPGSEPLSDLVALDKLCHDEAHGRFDSGKYRTLRVATMAMIEDKRKERAHKARSIVPLRPGKYLSRSRPPSTARP